MDLRVQDPGPGPVPLVVIRPVVYSIHVVSSGTFSPQDFLPHSVNFPFLLGAADADPSLSLGGAIAGTIGALAGNPTDPVSSAMLLPAAESGDGG